MNLSNSINGTEAPMTKAQFCALPTEGKFQAHSTFLIIILIVTFVGNLLVVLAVISYDRLRNITNYFIVSLAVSDLLIAVLSLPFRIDQSMHNAHWCMSPVACRTWVVIDSTCSFASIWNLAVISIDRYTAIVHPFRYHSLITNKVGFGLISFAWGFSFALALSLLMNWTDYGKEHFFYKEECTKTDKIFYTVSSAVSFYLPLLIVLVMYGAVFRVALNQAKAMAALQVAANKRGRRSSINLVREVKAAKTLAIVIGCFIVCWFPFTVLVQISLWDKDLLSKPLSKESQMALSLTFAYVLPALNSCLNPIIYALFNRDFRQAFIKMVKRITGQRLGAIGFGETSVHETASSTAANGVHHQRTIRFQAHDSESSEALPTIPMHDPNAFYNEGCHGSPATASILAPPNDSNSMETTLDDHGRKQSSVPMSNDRVDAETTPSNGAVVGNADSGENSSERNLPKKLPPVGNNNSKSTDDDVDLGEGRLAKPLPPIESTSNGELKPPPSPARSEHSQLSSSSLVNVGGSEQKDEDNNSDITDSVL